MIELGDHELLALLRGVALVGGQVGELQDHLEQRDPQAFGDAQIRRGPRRGLSAHGLLP